jgi:hypothetical protein
MMWLRKPNLQRVVKLMGGGAVENSNQTNLKLSRMVIVLLLKFEAVSSIPELQLAICKRRCDPTVFLMSFYQAAERFFC